MDGIRGDYQREWIVMLLASDLLENARVQSRDPRTMTPAQECAAD